MHTPLSGHTCPLVYAPILYRSGSLISPLDLSLLRSRICLRLDHLTSLATIQP